MDEQAFDALVKGLGAWGSRRVVLRALAAVLGGAGPALATAKDSKRRGRGADSGGKHRGRDAGRKRDARDRRGADGATGRVSGGTAVPPGKYPFAAWVRIATGTTSAASCSGSLIDATHVLTAAHCTTTESGTPYPLSAYTVVLGQVDRTITGCAACIKRVSGVARDPSWAGRPAFQVRGDLAVLTLDSPVDATVARPLALIGSGETGCESAGLTATVAGWGRTSTQTSSTLLREATLRVIDAAACRYDSATALCTSPEGGRDACKGDSGGPLFVRDGDRFVQIGVVSRGPGGEDCPSLGAMGEAFVRLSNADTNAFLRVAAPGVSTGSAGCRTGGPATTPSPVTPCSGGGACAAGEICCPPTAGDPDGGCAPGGSVCCRTGSGGYCDAGWQCCAPSPGSPDGGCAPVGADCCHTGDGGYCDPGWHCCAPRPATPNGSCALNGHSCDDADAARTRTRAAKGHAAVKVGAAPDRGAEGAPVRSGKGRNDRHGERRQRPSVP